MHVFVILQMHTYRLHCQASFTRALTCSLYRPPNNDVSYMTDLCNILTQIVESYPDSPIWIAGDINLSNIDWEY